MIVPSNKCPISLIDRISEFSITGKKIDDLEERMGKIVAKTVQDICESYEQRKLACQYNPKFLLKGMWYANEYYKAIAKDPDGKMCLQWLIKTDCFYHGVPSKFFNLIPSQKSISGYEVCAFKIAQGCKPSEALNSFKTEFSLVDCNMVCQIGQYHALLDVLGELKFNKLFRANGPTPLQIGNYASESNPIVNMIQEVTEDSGVYDNRPVKVGQVAGFRNTQKYLYKHGLMGESYSYNVVVCDATSNKQKYVGLGLPGAGASEMEIEQKMIDEYNSIPMDLSPLSDSTALKLWPFSKQSYKDICDLYESEEPVTRESIQEVSFGYVPEVLITLNTEMVQDMINTPIENFR